MKYENRKAMNRHITFLLCTAAVAAMSCSKQEKDPVRPVRDGFVRIELAASSENGDGTRTTIGSGSGSTRIVEWSKGDRILVNYGQGTAEGEAVGSGKTTVFSIEIPSDADKLLGVYPYDTPVNFTDGGMTLTIPSEQSGEFAKSNIAVTSTSAKAASCKFYNATSYIKFLVTDPDITKITVESVGGEPLVGKLPVSFDGEGAIVPGEPSDVSSEVSVYPDGIGECYVSILPGVNHADGLKVRFFIDGEGKYEISRGIYVSEDPVFVQRSQMASFGELDKRVGNIYVTVDGAGTKDGTSWENAISCQDLSNLLTLNSSSSSAREHCARMDGNTFRMGAGVYDLGYAPVVDFSLNESPCTIRFVGGYAANGSDVPDPDSHPTEISGGGDHQALVLRKNVSAMFSSLTVSGGVAWSECDAALQLRDGAAVRLDNCIVKDNRVADGKEFASAAVYVDAASSLTAKGSVFRENSGVEGAAARIDGAVRFSGCSFIKNVSSTRAGAVSIASAAGPAVVFEGCVFSENSVPDDIAGTKGGAVGFSGASADFKDCTFTGNSANQGGAVSLDGKGDLNLTDCIFDSNHSLWKYDEAAFSFGGAIDVTGAGRLLCNRCTFDGNYGTRGGAVSSQDGMAKLFFNACLFGANYIINGHGTQIYLNFSELCAINNCCFIEGSYSTLGSGNADWIGVEAAGELLIANTTMIGAHLKGVGATTGSNGLVRLGYVAATEHFINNLMALPNVNSNTSILARSELHTVYLYGNKRSKATAAGSQFITGYGDCEDYLQGTGYFGELALVRNGAAPQTYWKWNGELRNASDVTKMAGSDVRRLMNEVSPEFCQWLTDSCDNAMYTDQLGTVRGDVYWPGSYQNK